VECNEGDLKTVRIPIENKNNGSFVTASIEVCPACDEEYNKISDMLIDAKIAIFSKYCLPKGE
jgi:hypothetical protein